MTENSYKSFLSSVYRGILSDVSDTIPVLARDCERDLQRLLSLLKTRGLPFAMVDLPAFGKHFDRCLADGYFKRAEITGFRPYKRHGSIPRLFKGLILRIFEDSGMLKVDADVLAIRFVRQLCRAFKRFRMTCPPQKVREQVGKFIDTDRHLPQASERWLDDEVDFEDINSVHLRDCIGNLGFAFGDTGVPAAYGVEFCEVAQRVFDRISARFGIFNPDKAAFRHGPGAVSDLDLTVDWKYQFPGWSSRLDHVFPYADFAFANFGFWADAITEGKVVSSTLPISKLIAVPKTLDRPRLIASEPVANQWCQQSIRDFLCNGVEKSWLGRSIHFRDQSFNQQFALQSSSSQSHATIDLSDASDRISCWLIERAFRANVSLLRAFKACRTTHVRQDIDPRLPQVINLRKFSTMGSAVTFPVQSIVFLGLAIAAMHIARRTKPSYILDRRYAAQVRVFGDDIIIPIDSWTVLSGILHLYGLKVNTAKSFGTGKFRESCGVDAYNGNDVTPVSILAEPDYTRPESVISTVDVIHNLFNKGYWNTCKVLVKALPKRMKFSRVLPGSGAFGLPWDLWDHVNVHRVNKSLQRLEEKVHVPVSKQVRGLAEGGSAVLQYFTEACNARFVQGERLGQPRRSKNRLALRWVPCMLP